MVGAADAALKSGRAVAAAAVRVVLIAEMRSGQTMRMCCKRLLRLSAFFSGRRGYMGKNGRRTISGRAEERKKKLE